MTEQKNTLLAIVLSLIVLLAWQYFFGLGQMHPPQNQQQTQATPNAPGTPNTPAAIPGQATNNAAAPKALTREETLKQSARIPIDTPSLKGSISLKGGRIDDVLLARYHETIDPNSPLIDLFSPSGSPHPYYAEFGWTDVAGTSANRPKLPDENTVWSQEGSGTLTPGHPVVMTWDNGEGLKFHRTISVDDKYMFKVGDEVTNSGTQPVTLFPYGLISRHGTPETLGYYILHEGLIGYLGDKGEQQITYKKLAEQKQQTFSNVTNAWLGITDKYWAATLVPDSKVTLQTARFSTGEAAGQPTYQADFIMPQQVIAPGATASTSTRLFAGAKEVHVLNDYNKRYDLNHFDLLIDWGWFWFFTKPMFEFMDLIFRWTGNFGIAILIVTVAIKALFFPLANKSYASMAKMKSAQPQIQALKERYPDDRTKQQQEMMEIYKREKINPVAGCLPILIQIPVFFSLYKVLFITIEMRHAPFFGWIHDLSAPDPTNIFTLFGLIPWNPAIVPVFGSFMFLGVWPLIMGVTMWLQMKVNPPPPDPAQRVMFAWMPVIFTFMLAKFSAGLVIYWAWNNALSVTQQSIIMKKNGAKIELWDNLKALLPKRRSSSLVLLIGLLVPVLIVAAALILRA